MTCPTDETLAAHTAGLLLDDERATLEDHAAGCSLCRSTVAALAGVRTSKSDTVQLGAEGAAIGRYRIVGTIGEGAMGVVLRGYDPVLDREVAIKMSRAVGATPEQRDRAIREAQALARLDHPNVVRVFDAGSAGDEIFVAMEYVAGTNLSRWNDGTRTRADKLRVLAGVGAGLAAVHDAGLVHRDFKP
ncbi:MAG: serine/threonine-protein kinase, partial [Kofleriaceae bacterium]